MSLETTVVEEDIERETYTEKASKYFRNSILALGMLGLSVTGCDSAGPEPPEPPKDDETTISFQATGEAVTPHGNEVEGVAEAYAKGDKRDEEFFTGTFNLNSSVEVTNSVNGNVDPVQVQRDSVPKAREGIGNKSVDVDRGDVETRPKAMNRAKSSQATTNSSDGSLDLRVDVFDEAGHLEKISESKTVEDGGNFDLGTLNMEYTPKAPTFNVDIDFRNKKTGEPLDSVVTAIETPDGNMFSLRDSTGSETGESLSWKSASFEVPEDGYSVTFNRRGFKELTGKLDNDGGGFNKELEIGLEPKPIDKKVDVSVNGTLENTFNHTIPNASGALLVEGQEALSFQSDNQGNVSATGTVDLDKQENVQLTAVLNREHYQERDTTGTTTVQNGEVSMNLGDFLLNYDGSKTFEATGQVVGQNGEKINSGTTRVALGNKTLVDQISQGSYQVQTPIADHDEDEFDTANIIVKEVEGYETPREKKKSFTNPLTADFTLQEIVNSYTVDITVENKENGSPLNDVDVGSSELNTSKMTGNDGNVVFNYEAISSDSVKFTFEKLDFVSSDTTVAANTDHTFTKLLSPATSDMYEQVIKGDVTDDLSDVVDDGDAVVTSSSGETICDVTTQAFIDGDCVDTGEVGNEPDGYTIDIDRVHLQDQELTVPFEDAENADVELPREFYDIEGNIVNEANNPVSEQDVNVTFNDQTLTSTTTDANGNHSSEVTFYEVTDVENPEGDVVYPESEFYKQASVSFTAQDPNTTIDVGETTLEDKLIDASVEGNVSSSSGSVLEGAEVSADGTVVSGSDVTNSEGNYVIDFASVPVREAPSSIDMSASLSGFEDETDTISFESNMVKDFTLQEIVNNYTIDITVENKEDGSPINDVNVGSSDLNTSKMTGSDGNVEFSYQEDSSLNNLTFTFEKTDFVNSDTTVAANTNHTFTKALSPESPDMYEQVIKGNVTDDLSDVVDDGDAVVTSSNGETICDVTTQAFIDGDCVDTGEVGSEPDSYTIDIDRVHLEDQELTVPFEDAENADVELPREFYDIEGNIVNEANNPVSEQDVNVTFNDQTLTSTTTDANGNHSSEVTFYEVTEVENPEGEVVYPDSEFYKQASVGFAAQDPNTTVNVGETTLLDKLITATFQGNIFDNETNQGISNISVEYQTDQGHSKTATTDNMGDFSGQLDIAKRNEPATVDLIVNEGEEQGYESKTVQENFVKDLTKDVGLESLVQESINFTLDPYDVRGNAINDLTVSVKSPSGDVQTFPVENGEINVSYEVEDVQEALKIWHDFGSGNEYNDVLMIREQNQGVPPIAEDNIANNNMQEGWSHGEPFDTLSVEASQLDGKQNLDAYLAEYSHETNVGEVNINDPDASHLAYDRTGNIIFGYDEVDNIDKLRVLLFEYNLDDPDVDIDPEIINEEEQHLNQILSNLTEHPKVLDYEIDRISDPSELDPYEQDNFENTLRVWHEYTNGPTNGMGVEGSENRYSTPNVSLPSGGVKKGVFIEEITEASAGIQDAPGYGGSNPYTVSGEDENASLNSFGETVYNLNLLLNKGTEIE